MLGPFPPGTARTPLSDLQNGGASKQHARVGARGVSARLSNGLLVSGMQGDARKRPLTAGAHLNQRPHPGVKGPRRGVSAQPHPGPPSFLAVNGVSNARGVKLGAVLDSGDESPPVGAAGDVCDELMRILEHRARLPVDGIKRAGVQYSGFPPQEDSEAPGGGKATGGANGKELLKGKMASGERRASRERGGGSAGLLRGGMLLTADSAARESVRASGTAGAVAGGGGGVRASSSGVPGGGIASGQALA